MSAAMIVFAAALTVQQLANECFDRRLSAADPTNGLSRFSDYPRGADKDSFAPNPKFWGKGIDFSCASPWNSASGLFRAGTLISKRHFVCANHYGMPKGTRIVLVDGEGVVCPCVVKDTRKVGKTDIMVGLLDYEVTPNIHPAKVLPVDYEKYIGDGQGLPLVTFDQKERVFVSDLNELPGERVKSVPILKPKAELRGRFHHELVKGDSGNPAFLIIGNEPILLYCIRCGGLGYGPWIHRNRKEVQQVMDELCPGYKLEEFDFTRLIERH